MINLDDMSMDPNDLHQWWSKYRWATVHQRRELFGQTGPGTVRAMKDLANYAANKGTAMRLRVNGQIDRALAYEQICQKIYDGLPDFAKW